MYIVHVIYWVFLHNPFCMHSGINYQHFPKNCHETVEVAERWLSFFLNKLGFYSKKKQDVFYCKGGLNVSTPFNSSKVVNVCRLIAFFLISNTADDLQHKAAEDNVKDLILNLFTMGLCSRSVVPHFFILPLTNEANRVHFSSWKCGR